MLHLKSTHCDSSAESGLNVSLLALAASDLLCCVVMLPHGVMSENAAIFTQRSFHMIYRQYSAAFINTFMLSSTWLTVTMATSRYLAICHPYRARCVVTLPATKGSVAFVFIMSAALNGPRLFEHAVQVMTCFDGRFLYFLTTSGKFGEGNSDGLLYNIYTWVYFVTGVASPLTILAFCNVGLMIALLRSIKVRRQYRVPAAHVEANYRIMSILVAIVVMHIILVPPAELLRFVRQQALMDHIAQARALIIATEITNVMQALNFAFNFVLYCALNLRFRLVFRRFFVKICIHREFPTFRDDDEHKTRTPLSQSLVLHPSNITAV